VAYLKSSDLYSVYKREFRKENKRLRAKIRWYEGPHTPPNKNQSDQQESSSSSGDEGDEQPTYWRWNAW